MKIITNNHYRHILYFHELEPSEQEELKDSYGTIEESTFFRYRGQVYDLCDFLQVKGHCMNGQQENDDLSNWDGYKNESYFSSIFIKYDDSCEAVKVGLAIT